jgi:branched-subunit amino acid aminotransferase/4-amino-4-deoxychorismate lyase
MTGIAPDDRGFSLGHGLFETLLWEDHRLDHWEAHLERLARGCATLGMPAPDPYACRNAIEAALIAAGGPHRAAVRLNWSAGPGDRGLDPPATLRPVLSATATSLARTSEPARLVTVQVRRNDQSPTSRLKALAYLDNVLARAEARAAGADEALMLNTRSEVACAAAANVFWIRHGVVCTPSLDCGVLDGVIRAEVLAACVRLGIPNEQVRAPPVHLAGAPMFITNSLVGVRPVSALDGVAASASPLIAAIARAVRPAPR